MTKTIRVSDEQHEKLTEIQKSHDYSPDLKQLANKAIEDLHDKEVKEA